MTTRSFDSLLPTETVEIENGLSLVPRVKLILTVYPSDSASATKPIDEWKLKRALIDFLKASLSVSVVVPEDDLEIRRYKDIKKRKRGDSVAHGTLCIRDLGFLHNEKEMDQDLKVLEKKFLDWRKYIVEKMDGIELNLEGYKYNLSVAVPDTDDFEGMKKAWQDFYAFGNRGYSRGVKQEPDTIILRGVPSRWFAEPRVSSKPSMLVTHTIFSSFGKIRNLSVAEDDDFSKDVDEDGGDIISGLHCKIVVQFEKYEDFYSALKVLCGRSLQKQGSRLRADYEVTCAKDNLFRNLSSLAKGKSERVPEVTGLHYRHEAHSHPGRYNSQRTSDYTPRKRFKMRAASNMTSKDKAEQACQRTSSRGPLLSFQGFSS